MTHTEENTLLRRDLNKLWINNHLTLNHRLGIRPCPCVQDNGKTCGQTAHHLEKNGERYEATDQLLRDIKSLAAKYKFDSLETWPCCHDCGQILFERTVDGTVFDEFVNEDGEVEPTAGISQEEEQGGPQMIMVDATAPGARDKIAQHMEEIYDHISDLFYGDTTGTDELESFIQDRIGFGREVVDTTGNPTSLLMIAEVLKIMICDTKMMMSAEEAA